MPLSELSTELDCNIAAHLVGDTQTLSAFSKVSKYYRNIVEPYLYHDITFHDLDTYYIRCLLVTILDCPSVGLHIRRFNIGQDFHMRREADMDAESILRKKLWDRANRIRDRIDQVMRLFPEEIQSIVGTEAVDFCHQWAGSCYKSSSADPVAALIMCIAQNIDFVSLRGGGSHIHTTVCQLLGLHWPGDRPFHKLRKLSTYSSSPDDEPFIAISPGIESLCVAKKQPTSWGVLYPDECVTIPPLSLTPVTPTLTSLRFEGLDISPEVVRSIIVTPWLASLRKLRVLSCVGFSADEPEYWNYLALLRAMEKYTPKLRVFTWAEQQTYQFGIGFDTFKNLLQLQDLRVDYQLINPNNETHLQVFSEPKTILPQGLTELAISNISVEDLGLVVEELEILRASTSSASGSLRFSHEPVPYSRLSLDISFEKEMDDDDSSRQFEMSDGTIGALRNMADGLIACGIKLKVSRIPEVLGASSKLLVEPGFTAEKPYSVPPSKVEGPGLVMQEEPTSVIQEEELYQGEESEVGEESESDAEMDADLDSDYVATDDDSDMDA